MNLQPFWWVGVFMGRVMSKKDPMQLNEIGLVWVSFWNFFVQPEPIQPNLNQVRLGWVIGLFFFVLGEGTTKNDIITDPKIIKQPNQALNPNIHKKMHQNNPNLKLVHDQKQYHSTLFWFQPKITTIQQWEEWNRQGQKKRITGAYEKTKAFPSPSPICPSKHPIRELASQGAMLCLRTHDLYSS